MRLLDLKYLERVINTIDLDSGQYSNNDNMHHVRELINFIFSFPSISQLIVLMYTKRCDKRDQNSIEKRLYRVLECINMLAHDYLKYDSTFYKPTKSSYTKEYVLDLK